MPKIQICSDLHLEFGPLTLPGGDILLIAGDMCEAGSPASTTTRIREYVNNFVKYELRKYKKVYYVFGNHEYYNSTLLSAPRLIAEMLIKNSVTNVTILENACDEYEGILFVGATLWTDCNGKDDLTRNYLRRRMNDYVVISSKDDYFSVLLPDETMAMHDYSKEYITQTLAENKNKPVVVLTHHAPTMSSIPQQYRGDYMMNGGYASRLEELILAHPQIKVWAHGHCHNRTSYMVGDTKVIVNARGYYRHEYVGIDYYPMEITV